MPDTIYAQHPDPNKEGVNISKEKYDQIHEAIVSAFGGQEELSLKELTGSVKDQVAGTFNGSIGWYVTVVKLDMESRGGVSL